jgi:predicted metal-dependent peptidase
VDISYKGLEETVIYMINNYSFYGNLVSIMDKKLTTEVPIAAVSITTKVNLYINPRTFNPLPLEVRVGILIHECMHILHDHIARSKKVSTSFNKALNIAADRAINEKIHVLTKNGKLTATIPDSLPLTEAMREAFGATKKDTSGKATAGSDDIKFVTKKNFQDTYKDKVVLDGESMEYYYKFLKENAKKGQPGESGDFDGDMETIDDHEQWEEGDNSEEVTREITKNALNKAARKTGAGNIPGEVQQALDELNKSVVDWKKELRVFIAQAQNTLIDSSRKKRNRRYGIIHPGIVKRPQLKLGIAYDTSGSVPDQYLQQFFGEIKKIHSLGIEIFLVEADMIVQSAKKYNPKEKIVVKGRGGTAFQPAIDRLHEEDVDAILYLTDGECSEDIKVNRPFMWGLCPSYSIPSGNHRYIKIMLPQEK